MRYETIYLVEHFPKLKGEGCNPKLEIYLPEAMVEMGWGDKKRPCIFICPGGGYHGVSRREAEPIALKFLEQGYNVFVLTYSVAPHRFPQQLREVAAAMELIHVNADEWLCNVEKVAIVGFSAGGHLAAHYSNAYDWPEVREMFPDSKPVQAAILSYPVITCDKAYPHQGSFKNLLGEYPEEGDMRFACDHMVSEKTPATFLWHTAVDQAVPVENTLLYAMALKKHKVPFEVHIYPEGVHGLATVDGMTCREDTTETNAARSNKWVEEARSWLRMIWK